MKAVNNLREAIQIVLLYGNSSSKQRFAYSKILYFYSVFITRFFEYEYLLEKYTIPNYQIKSIDVARLSHQIIKINEPIYEIIKNCRYDIDEAIKVYVHSDHFPKKEELTTAYNFYRVGHQDVTKH